MQKLKRKKWLKDAKNIVLSKGGFLCFTAKFKQLLKTYLFGEHGTL